MKHIKLIVILTATLCLAGMARAQVNNTNPPSQQNFFQTAAEWGTSFNTNLTWVGTEYELGVGADFEGGVQWANDLDAQYDVNGGNIGLGARMRNAGIAGVVESYEAKLEYSFLNEYDLRGEVSLYAGFDHQYNAALVEPQIGLRKKMTATTFAGIYMSVPCMFGAHNVPNQWVPNFGIETGICGGNAIMAPPLALRVHISRAMTDFRHLADPWHYD